MNGYGYYEIKRDINGLYVVFPYTDDGELVSSYGDLPKFPSITAAVVYAEECSNDAGIYIDKSCYGENGLL